MVTWGTSPEDVIPVTGNVPDPESFATPDKRAAAHRALDYMGLTAGQPISRSPHRPGVHRLVHQQPDRGHAGRRRRGAGSLPARPPGRADHVKAMVVPGSGLVKEQAEEEGLDAIFKAAGFDWREPGCSMCLAMNPDKLAAG